jgi:hypothetical protein
MDDSQIRVTLSRHRVASDANDSGLEHDYPQSLALFPGAVAMNAAAMPYHDGCDQSVLSPWRRRRAGRARNPFVQTN